MKAGDAALLDADLSNWSTVEIVEVRDVFATVRAHKDGEPWDVMKSRLTVIVPSEITEL